MTSAELLDGPLVTSRDENVMVPKRGIEKFLNGFRHVQTKLRSTQVGPELGILKLSLSDEHVV